MGGLTPIFWQNTLPLMVTILIAVFAATLVGWISNANMSKRIEDVKTNLSRRIEDSNTNICKRLGDIISRLARIEVKLEGHEERITRLEERTSPLRR